MPGALGEAGQEPGGQGSPFSEKEEFPWTGGESSPLWMVEENSHTRDV